MNMAIGSDSLYTSAADLLSNRVKAEELQSQLKNESASDEELMEACKSFEAYLTEQVMKAMEKTIPNREEKNPYLEYFGDNLYTEYASMVTENKGLGIAQMLYEAMKRNL